MKKKDILFLILFLISFFLIMIAIVAGIIMFIESDKEEIPAMFGTFGIIGFAVMYIGGFFLGKKDENIDEYQMHERYKKLVEKAETNLKAFNRKLIRLTYVGKIYTVMLILFIILTLVGLIMFGVETNISMGWAGLLGFGMVAAMYNVVKSIYIKPDEVIGNQITKEEFPEIYKIIDNAIKKTNSPNLDRVFTFPDNNCFVSCVPVGFGFHNQNIMFLGLHILEILSSKELEAVLLHELAHIYREDTLISNKIGRSITRWRKILDSSMKGGSINNNLLTNFASYFISKTDMHLLAISQQREFMADKEAIKYVNKNIYFTAMAKIELMQYFFSRPIEETWLDIRSFEQAPQNYYDLLFSEFYKRYETNKEVWSNQITKSISSKYYTHPSFSERMNKIGIEKYEFDLKFNAEEEGYKLELKKLKDVFNKEWYDNMHENWDEYCKEYKESVKIVDEYIQTDDVEKNIEYGIALETLNRYDSAIELYNRILDIDSNHDVALFRKGLLLLHKNDESGIELVKKSMELNNECIEFGLETIGNFINDNGLEDKKKELLDWSIEMSRIENKRRDELENLYTNDSFVTTTLDEEKVLEVKRIISEIPRMVSAHLVEKKLQYSKGNLVILAILYKGKYIGVEEMNKLHECLQTIDIPYFILDLKLDTNANIYLMKPISKVEGSEIYNIKRKNNK